MTKRITLVRLTSKGKEKLNIFYNYNMALLRSKMLETNMIEYETMITGMRNVSFLRWSKEWRH